MGRIMTIEMIKDGKECPLSSPEEAIKLHLEMWGDMQKALGDTPNSVAREDYKRNWLMRKGYENVANNCFLCEFANHAWCHDFRTSNTYCDNCPINWASLSRGPNGDRCHDLYIHGIGDIYLCAPISEILALPVKGE